jgi:hypothetical protein
VKRLICELRSKNYESDLDWDEQLIYEYIRPVIDYTSPIVQFQLAADLGERQGDQCKVVYSR